MKENSALKIGMKMEDSAIFAGISPDTNEPMFAAPADEPLSLTFSKAKQRAEEKTKETGKAYRVPSASELNVLFNNRAAIGAFNEASLYRSSTPSDFNPVHYAKVQRFNDGKQDIDNKRYGLSVRLVRA